MDYLRLVLYFFEAILICLGLREASPPQSGQTVSVQALPGLLRLPRELRDQIYEHLYANAIGTEPMIVSLQRRDSTIYCFDIRQFWLVRNMFSVSRLLRDESIEHIIGAGKNVKRNIGIELPFPNRWQLNRLPAWLQTRILVIEDSRPFISARTLDGPASCLPNLEKIAVSQRRSVQHGRETITDAADLRRLLRGSHDNWISASGDSYDYLLGNPPKMNLEGGQIEVTIISYTDIRTTDYTIPSRDPVSRVYILEFDAYDRRTIQRYVNLAGDYPSRSTRGLIIRPRYVEDLVLESEVDVLSSGVDRPVLYHIPSGRFRIMVPAVRTRVYCNTVEMARIEAEVEVAAEQLRLKIREQVEDLRERGQLPTKL